MATVTPDNLTVKFNLKGSVILDIDTYNELRLRADMYDEMLFSCVENFKVIDKDPSTWSPATCTVEGHFEIPTGIFNAVVNSLVSKLINNDAWMASIVKGGEVWLDLDEGMLSSYNTSHKHSYYLLDNKQFADKYFSMREEDEEGDSND